MTAWISLRTSQAIKQSREVRQQSRALCWLGQDTMNQSRQILTRAAQLRSHTAQQRMLPVPARNRQYRDTVTEVFASLLFSEALCFLLDQSALGMYLDLQGRDDVAEVIRPVCVIFPATLAD